MTSFEYARRVARYNATPASVLAAEVRRLHAAGVSAEKIAEALRLDIGTVLSMLMMRVQP